MTSRALAPPKLAANRVGPERGTVVFTVESFIGDCIEASGAPQPQLAVLPTDVVDAVRIHQNEDLRK